MAQLDDAIHERIERLSEQGNELAENGEYATAISLYEEALAELPSPIDQWEAALWLQVAIADAAFLGGDYELCRSTLTTSVSQFDEARANPFVRLRLGQALFECGDAKASEEWLVGAYLLDGLALFQDDDPKYLLHAKHRLQAPEGGWPEGW